MRMSKYREENDYAFEEIKSHILTLLVGFESILRMGIQK
jgi:hypothetical protein